MHPRRATLLTLALLAAGPLVAASVTVTPASHDFGTVPSGQRKIVTIRVANDGVLAKTVPVKSSSPLFTVSDSSLEIPGRKSVSLVVGISDKAPAGAQSATITIGDGRDAVRLDVRARVEAPAPPTPKPTALGNPGVTVGPTSLDFGTLELDQSKTLTFTATSPSSASCNVLLAFGTNPQVFSPSATSLTLSPGQPATVSVTFTAKALLRISFQGPLQGLATGQLQVVCGISKATVDLRGSLAVRDKYSIAVASKGLPSVITGTTSDARLGTILSCQNNGGSCSNTVQAGVRVDLKAACNAPALKLQWTSGTGSAVLCNGTTSPTCSFVINGDSAVTAECTK